jgi:hypothetical protein
MPGNDIVNNPNGKHMHLYPIKTNFFDRESDLYYNYEGKKGSPNFFGDFGAIYTTRLHSKYSINHICFDLKQPTWLFYKFSELHSLLILAIDNISFELREKKYHIEPNSFCHISGFDSPEFFHFPIGRYEFYTISGAELDTELEICRREYYDKIKEGIDYSTNRQILQSNKTINI